MHIYIYTYSQLSVCACVYVLYMIYTYRHGIYHIWYIYIYYIINHIWYMIWLRNLICPHILYTKTCPWHDIIFSLTWSSARSRCLQLQAWGFWRSSRNSTIQTGEVDEGARFDPVWSWFWANLGIWIGCLANKHGSVCSEPDTWKTSCWGKMQWKCGFQVEIRVESQILMRQVLWGQKIFSHLRLFH